MGQRDRRHVGVNHDGISHAGNVLRGWAYGLIPYHIHTAPDRCMDPASRGIPWRVTVAPMMRIGRLATLMVALVSTSVSAQDASPVRTVAFTTTSGTWISLDVTRDGRTLLLELLGDIYTLPVDGGRARPLLTGRAFQSQPRLSPDGTQLVYISDESGSDNLWIAQSDGRGARQVTRVPRSGMLSPAWTPDGRAIVVTVTDPHVTRTAELWRFDVTTGDGVRLQENTNGLPAPLVSSPAPGPYGAWPTPDGASVWFTSVTPRPYGSRSGATSTIMRVAATGGAAEPIVVEGTPAMKPMLSPDGSTLVYGTMREGRTGLKVRNLRTGAEHWLAYPIDRHQLEARASRDVLPNSAFSPDGRWVYAAFGGQLHRLGVADGSDTVIPFSVDVSLDVTPTIRVAHRVDTGAVRTRRAQAVAVASDGRRAFSALGRIWLSDNAPRATPQRLTKTLRAREYMPAWSPDGRWVAYVTWDEEGGTLWKARSDGREMPVQLSTTPAAWLNPTWSTDGRTISAITAPLRSSLLVPPGVIPPDAQRVEIPASGGTPRVLGPAPRSNSAPAPVAAIPEVALPRAKSSGTVVLRGATVITMRGEDVVRDADVVVTNGRITQVGAQRAQAMPAEARVIDVRGKYIVPGFIDLHAHWFGSGKLLQPESSNGLANFALGITTIRDPQNDPDIFGLAELVEVDDVPSPRIFSTGPAIGAATNLQSLEDARRVVRRYRDEYGTAYLKSYQTGTRQQRQWLVEAARELGMMPTTEG
ncbi:MAG: hypothetical protein RLZZ621_10, partial [Gemmatimonadota bacterium]